MNYRSALVLIVMVMILMLLTACAAVAPKDNRYEQTVMPVVRIAQYRYLNVPPPSVARLTSHGSGVIVQSDKEGTLIVSNHHVVHKADYLETEYEGKTYNLTVVKENEQTDLALLHAPFQTKHVAHIHDEITLNMFDRVIIVGAGLGNIPYPSLGIVSIPDHELGIVFSAPVVGGKSGGGVWRPHTVDEITHYELVGITSNIFNQLTKLRDQTFAATPVNNLGIAIPMSKVKTFLQAR